MVSEERRLLVAASLMLRAAETAGASIGDLLPLVVQIVAAEPPASAAHAWHARPPREMPRVRATANRRGPRDEAPWRGHR